MLANMRQRTIKPAITAAAAPGTLVHTDGYGVCARLPSWGCGHKTVSHGRDYDGDSPEIVRGVAGRLGDGRLLVLGYDIDELEQVEGIILRALGLGLAPAVLLSLVGGSVLARRGQRRSAALHEAVGKIMQGHLHERLPVRGGSDELDKLAMAVSGMLGQIERLVGSRLASNSSTLPSRMIFDRYDPTWPNSAQALQAARETTA